MIVHIDCNSFYASCEVSFRPDLKGKPVVVANCNEAGGGIILALTKEAKALGLKRGNPVFQAKDILEKNEVAIFPANLKKYCDISQRIMQIVIEQDIIQNFIQYSVDEFFGTIPIEELTEIRKYIELVKESIYQGTSIPVSCGASTTYTLAKVATWFAKHYPAYHEICILPKEKINTALVKLPIENIWGLGRASIQKLHYENINTGYDFSYKSEDFIKKRFSVTGLRTWKELHGIPCIDISTPPKQQSIMYSRTFAYMTNSKDTLITYISNYAAGAARKLRDQHCVCSSITTFIGTNRHRMDLMQYRNSACQRLNTATAETTIIVKAAIEMLKQIYREGYEYKKAGIILNDISDDTAIQMDLFALPKENPKRQRKLMQITDAINSRYGMDMIRVASQGYDTFKTNFKGFQPLKNETTNIDDIINIDCSK
jgi:DNA polymerase V